MLASRGAGGADPLSELPPGPRAAPGYVIVPHAAGPVYVPLDQSGQPLFPSGTPGPPAAPWSPSWPPVPDMLPTPWQPAWTPGDRELGYLRVEVEPPTAAVFVGGRYVGTAGQLGAPGVLLALPPGRHQLDALLPAFKPLRATVELPPGGSATLRANLEPDPAGRTRDVRRDGYFVTPPAAREPEENPRGGGYYVVPKP
jgi:hypothetical protein